MRCSASTAAVEVGWAEGRGTVSVLLEGRAEGVADRTESIRGLLGEGATATGELTLGRYGGSPDATLAAMLLIEMSARFGGKLRALIDETKGKG